VEEGADFGLMTDNYHKNEIRKFGIIALCFFGALCALALWRDRTIPSVFFGFLALLGLGFLLLPGPMGPVHAGWLKVAHAIGRAITTVIMTLSFYLVITPSGLLKRVLGGRPIPGKPDRDAETYWITREEPAQPKERFYKRF